MRGFIICLFLLSACGQVSKEVGKSLPNVPIEIDPTLAIQAANGSGGHACPVNGYVLTASHVLWDGNLRTYVPASWSFGNKSEGSAQVVGGYSHLDLLFLDIYGGEIDFLPAGRAKTGDKVYWFEYDFRTSRNALRARRRFANVLRTVAGHYIFDGMPVGGASGTCLLNSQGEVVGIVVAGWFTDDKLGVGSAVKLPEELMHE